MTIDLKTGHSPPQEFMEDEVPPGRDERVTAALARFIAQKMEELGIKSEIEVARRGGGKSADAIRDIRRGSVPGSKKIAIIAKGLGVDASVLHDLISPREEPKQTPDSRQINANAPPERRGNANLPAINVDPPRSQRLDAGITNLPLFRQGTPGMPDTHVSTIARPPQLVGRPEAYAFYVPDDQNAPMVRSGHVAYVDPSRPIVLDNWVRVFLAHAAPFIGILVDRTIGKIMVRVLSEVDPLVIESDAVTHMERIVGFMLLDA